MPSKEAIAFFNRFKAYPPEIQSRANLDKIAELYPDINIREFAKRFGITTEPIAIPDVPQSDEFGLDNMLPSTPEPWTAPGPMPSTPEDVSLQISPHIPFLKPTRNPEGTALKTGLNFAKGFGAMLVDTPNFLINELPRLAKGSVTPGEPGFGDMIASMAHDTGSLVALAAMKQLNPEEYKRFTTKIPEGIEAQRVINEEGLRPLMGPMMLAGGLRVSERLGMGKAKIVETKHAIRTPDVQILPQLEGMEGPVVKLGGRTGKTYYRDPAKGWTDYHTGKLAKKSVSKILEEQTSGIRGEGAPAMIKPLAIPTSTLERATTDTREKMQAERTAYEEAGKPGEILESSERPIVESKPPISLPQKPIEAENLGLNLEEISKVREYAGLKELPPAEQRAWTEVLGRAKIEGLDKNALDIAEQVRVSNRGISDAEHAGMVLKVVELKNEFNKIMSEGAEQAQAGNRAGHTFAVERGNIVLDQIDRLTDASRTAGREVARALNIRKMLLNTETYDIATITRQARFRKGARLSDSEMEGFTELVKRNKQLETRLSELESTESVRMAEIERLRATGTANRMATRERIRTQSSERKAKIKVDDDLILSALRERGFQLNININPQDYYLIGKYAINRIKEGVTSLDEVVRLTKERIPELTDHDVYRAINMKDPVVQARARSEVQRNIAHIKRQAKLLTDIEAAEKGIFEQPKDVSVASPEIRILQERLRELRKEAYKSDNLDSRRLEQAIKTINELQDQLSGHYRNIKKGVKIDSADLVDAKAKIAELRRVMRTEDELAILNDQLRTGEFVIKERPRQQRSSPELERTQIELRAARRKIKIALQNLQPKGAGGWTVEGINTLRTLKATADMSYTLRQGLVLSTTRPITASKVFGQAFQATFSQYKADQIDASLRNRPSHYLGEKAGLHLSELDGGINLREEMFQAAMIERVPVVGDIIKASSRHMTTGLNVLRTSVFDQFLEQVPNATSAELAAWANYINVATGRGHFGKLPQAATLLSPVIFAPRFTASRLQTPYYMAKLMLKEPRLRKQAARDAVGLVGLGLTALTLAKLSGADVNIGDPNSPDWGKIKYGNTRIDIWGGLLPPARLVTRLSQAGYARVKGEDLGRYNIKDELANFASFRLSPLTSGGYELLQGKTVVGEETTPLGTLGHTLMPLVYQDIKDAWNEGGLKSSLTTGGLNFLGVSTQTYDKSGSGGSGR